MEYTISSERGQRNKEKLLNMAKAVGYDNLAQLCKDVGIKLPNLYSNLDGTWNMSVKRMFKLADMLEVSILEMIDIFYPEELAHNQSLL